VKGKWLVGLVLAVAVLVNMKPIPLSIQVKAAETTCIRGAQLKLKDDMEKGWLDHTIWTRSYIVSALAELPDQKETLNRLLRNQQDIGNVIKPYYGEDAGNKLAALLREHIIIAGKIIDAAKHNKQDAVKALEADWHVNADEIAKFLSDANTNWTYKELQEMLYTHLQFITDIVLARLKGDWKSDIAITDKNEEHMIHMADYLTKGIVKQFPDKFK